MKKKNKALPILLITLLVLAVGVLAYLQFSQSFISDRYIEAPLFASITCSQKGQSAFSFFDVSKSGEWISDRFPENTNEWAIRIYSDDYERGFFDKRVEYYLCNSRSFTGCEPKYIIISAGSDFQDINLGTISTRKHLWIQLQRRNPNPFGKVWIEDDSNFITAEATFKPFVLIRNDVLRGGTQTIQNDEGCVIPTGDTEWRNRVIGYEGSRNVAGYSGGNELGIGETINYITGTILTVSEGNLQSGGWCIYENGRGNIYEIEEIETGSGTYKSVNTDERIKQVECCDGEVYPNQKICQSGKFIEIQEAECSRRSDCGTLEFFATGSNLIGRYDCVEGSCEIVDEKEVECTSDRNCLSNEICSNFECKKVGTGEGVGTPDINNTSGLDCKWYQEEYIKSEREISILGIIKYTIPEQEPICRNQSWLNWSIALGIILTILLAILGVRRFKK